MLKMTLHNLSKLKQSSKKRLGRGNATGQGTFAGRGNKGMGQRKSGNVRPGFEGGQTPLLQRIPKLKGFKSPNKITYQVVNLADLDKFQDEKVSVETLYNNRLIRKRNHPVKILSQGELKKKLEFDHDLSFSKSAKEKIIKAGGKILTIK